MDIKRKINNYNNMEEIHITNSKKKITWIESQ